MGIKLLFSTSGIPLIYEFNEDFAPIKHYYLSDDETLEKAIQEVIDEIKRDPKKTCS